MTAMPRGEAPAVTWPMEPSCSHPSQSTGVRSVGPWGTSRLAFAIGGGDGRTQLSLVTSDQRTAFLVCGILMTPSICFTLVLGVRVSVVREERAGCGMLEDRHWAGYV